MESIIFLRWLIPNEKGAYNQHKINCVGRCTIYHSHTHFCLHLDCGLGWTYLARRDSRAHVSSSEWNLQHLSSILRGDCLLRGDDIDNSWLWDPIQLLIDWNRDDLDNANLIQWHCSLLYHRQWSLFIPTWGNCCRLDQERIRWSRGHAICNCKNIWWRETILEENLKRLSPRWCFWRLVDAHRGQHQILDGKSFQGYWVLWGIAAQAKVTFDQQCALNPDTHNEVFLQRLHTWCASSSTVCWKNHDVALLISIQWRWHYHYRWSVSRLLLFHR